MKAIALAVGFSLAIGGSALAAGHERAPTKVKPACVTITNLKNDLKDIEGVRLTPLNISQYHFMMGIYAATPPIGLPANTDNAFLLQIKGKPSLVIWMDAECASKTPPTQISDQLVAMLRTIAPVAGESSDDPKDELKL